ncbi:DUF2844 domain-containing protein [Burkholderia sp. FERM BP-3421]|uniref:DUF2844 domain-containing protein n=1 Tax=Burkholderia sp. FERM BP-3421 TaxID=1494466 RepID=UPI00235E22E2|nr:DUF2844 domain-containing protein [Burkholderia sp. FERM BP-3421]WDD95981.1 DUF2844 domain-containing protein [Burkholderia sp. FERM BP-3421]
MKSIRTGRIAALAAAGMLGAASAGPACAALGGAPMTPPAADNAAKVRLLQRSAQASLRASGVAAAAPGANYTVRETTLGSGTVVREYLAGDGTVFALSWRGPVVPDLSDLLGPYFPQLVDGARVTQLVHGVRAPVAVDADNLVVHTGGHMGAFSGQAWLPQALPAGFTGNDIQ